MRDQTISDFLERLAAKVPAPGGGAAAALQAGQAAALLGMVARYSDGEKYRDHAGTIGRVRDEADRLRGVALGLAEDDMAAFGAVAEAYKLPKATDEEKRARSEAIASALAEAARPPAETVAAASRLVELAEELLPVGNRNVITDVAAAAEAARSALTTARVNVEINLGGVTDDKARDELAAALAGVDAQVARADRITAAVREEIAR
ncbi:cyclodeaminase/cyclohydrolase family protein [Sphaerisporangium fuscum]|uniref:cyclodeaminase/cyclohydrolase family protein n=1 Tax=Sphaerisporangium fuscum TaxID=2835868 RepID=UPI001BDCBF96|nr:cyclodeaminase/cyclohydrolase family protein [Sphaerisporangium fuscum]